MASRPVRRKRRFREQASEGFSLIEVMVAMTFLGIGLLAVAQMIPTGMAGITQARVRTNAVQAAQQRIDALRAEDFADVVAGAFSDSTGNYVLNWTITVDDPIPGMKRVNMSATWENLTGPKTVNMSTYLTAGQ
jgi:prepilin-type N-terminal cleavage/methylation domain-containing protein